jgi:hypothetical protein
MKYETIPVVVEAVQFQLDEQGCSNIPSVKLEECYCADLAQDGRYCPQHQTSPVLIFRTEFGGGEPIYPGQFLVIFPGNKVRIYTPANFTKLFREVAS